MLGAFGEQTTCSDNDVTMFAAFKPQVLAFIGMTATPYAKFVPLTYSMQVVQGKNYKVTYDVSSNATDKKVLIVVVNVPTAIVGQNATPTVLSAVLPSGQRQISAGSHADQTSTDSCGSGSSAMGGVSCWKTVTADLKSQFIGYQAAIQEFHGSKHYGTDFEPIKYKSQVTNGVVYTIQYQVKTGTVQATVYVPAVMNTVGTGADKQVKKVSQAPEVTQFVDEKGVVTGAFKLGASIMMAASLVATLTFV